MQPIELLIYCMCSTNQMVQCDFMARWFSAIFLLTPVVQYHEFLLVNKTYVHCSVLVTLNVCSNNFG